MVGRSRVGKDLGSDSLSAMLACFPMRVDAELAGVITRGAQVAYPAPEVPSLAGLDPPQGWPGSVEKLAAEGSALGWHVRKQYARGHLPHATTGTPGASQDSYAVRFVRHSREPDGSQLFWGAWAIRRGDGWPFVWMWGTTLLPFGLAGVTDLRSWLAGAHADAQWFDAIRKRVADQEKARKAAAAARPRAKREGMS